MATPDDVLQEGEKGAREICNYLMMIPMTIFFSLHRPKRLPFYICIQCNSSG